MKKRIVSLLAAALLLGGGLAAAAVPAQAGAPYSCTTSDPQGGCPSSGAGYTSYAGFSGFSGDWLYGSPYVDADEWGAVPGETQTINANSPGDWQAVVNIPAGSNPSGAVTTYPDAGMQFNNPPLTSFGDITSSLADTVPQGSADVGWQGYDNWFNSWGDEVMIQTNYIHQFPCTFVAVQQFGGSNGVPVQTWGLCSFGGAGGEKVWQLAQSGAQVGGQNNYSVMETSGSVDITAMTDWLITHGYMLTSTPAATTLTALSAGFEVTETASGGSTWTYTNLTFVNHTGASPPTGPVTSVNDTGKCMDDRADSSVNGAQVQLWDCLGNANQRWAVNPDGTLTINGKCLDVTGQGTANGTRVELYTCNGGTNQQWHQAVPGGELVSAQSGKCLDDPGFSTANGTLLDIWACKAGYTNIEWNLP